MGGTRDAGFDTMFEIDFIWVTRLVMNQEAKHVNGTPMLPEAFTRARWSCACSCFRVIGQGVGGEWLEGSFQCPDALVMVIEVGRCKVPPTVRVFTPLPPQIRQISKR